MMTRFGQSAVERRVNQSGLRRLQLAAVAASAFRIEEQVVLLQHLGDVRLERDQVGRILGVAADRDRAGDVAVDQAERAAEQIDARRRSAAAGCRCRRAPAARPGSRCGSCDSRRRRCGVPRVGGDDVVQVLVLALDLAEDRIERMLQRAVEPVPLRGAQLLEIGVDPLARLLAALAVMPPRRYLTTSSRARTAWAMSSSMETESDYSTGSGASRGCGRQA